MKYYLAIDIGASSGRHVIGWKEDGRIHTDEVYRFKNGVKQKDGHLIWDHIHLLESVKAGIDLALQKYPVIESLAIDTWAVDYVLLHDGKVLSPVYSYRDQRTKSCIDQVHALIPFEKLYEITGIQFQPFNTIYQLYADQLCGRLDQADTLMMIPEWLTFELCGHTEREYTNATTTGMLNAVTKQYDPQLLKTLGYPFRLFPSVVSPGSQVGTYKGIRCTLCASHDTASALEGMHLQEDMPYISSGTWSLLGIKTEKAYTDKTCRINNWSNEGGVGYVRHQKNIMGMCLINRLREELCPDASYDQIMMEARQSFCSTYVDADDPRFLSPASMKEAFDEVSNHILCTTGDYFRCACLSLAHSYDQAINQLEQTTGRSYKSIYIAGGGANNTFLNELTQQVTGRTVIADPVEATALGNLKIQMEVTQ